ncbi:unnamed protein product [Vitrella brassicaformis CCMP3155]|uniref:Alginate lyase domain-containing protein n=1 Tax=Vitrella brassicaformis (strain CCMP3155) TaxID=1169540 RepID=A0A0G4FGL2_VITBC|nr:unnamed protein product [Vitrella brassicaformis CCMP3155]|eukprot:CEM11993.1 unnamed protein product [Vitrella brassicaformis CCMP3155]
MSLARYWWPNVTKENPSGLPYINIDGKTNPEIHSVPDYKNLRDLFLSVERLGLGYYFLEDERYAKDAVEKIRVWFLDDDTRMNPHLEYAQIVRGHPRGRRQGVVDMSVSYQLFDGIALIKNSKHWTEQDENGMQAWFEEYIDWQTNSNHGKKESARNNNHGLLYDVQYISTALFLKETDLANRKARMALEKRIGVQIDHTGVQKHEVKRATSWFYSLFGLNAQLLLARVAANVEVDNYHYVAKSGGSIKKAIDFLIPHGLSHGKKWPFSNQGGFNMDRLVEHLAIAYVIYGLDKPRNQCISFAVGGVVNGGIE